MSWNPYKTPERERLYSRVILIGAGVVLLAFGIFCYSISPNAGAFSISAGILELVVGICCFKKTK